MKGRMWFNLTGHDHYAFSMAFTRNGRTKRAFLGDHPEILDRKELEAPQAQSSSWPFHDPFDGPEYSCVQWQHVDRRTMEHLMGASFEPNDFVSNKSMEFPTSPGVMS